MQRSFGVLATAAASGLLLCLASCSSCSRNLQTSSQSSSPPSTSSSSSPGPGAGAATDVPDGFYTPPGTVFNVTYTPNTVRIDLPTARRTLRGISDDGWVLVFDPSDPRIRDLAPGKILFLEHMGVRKVTAVQTQDSQLGVATEEAALTDFIQDGDIEFNAPVNFSQLGALHAPPKPIKFPTLRQWFDSPLTVYAANKGTISVHTKGEINDWEFELEGEPEGDGIALTFDAAKKKLAGITASIKAKGELAHVSTAFKVLIHGGKMQDFEYQTPITGKLHVTWAVLTSGENSGIGEARLKLPPFAKDVFDIYGIPFLFQVTEALIFKPGLGGKKDAAEGGFNVTYDGDGGLVIHGGQSTPKGKMEAQPEPEKTTAESLAPHGVVIAIDAPKVSVSLGTESLTEAIKEAMPGGLPNKVANFLENGPFGLGGLIKKAKEDFFKIEGAAFLQLVTEFDYAGSGPLSIVPCSMTHLNFYAQAGADATVLGIQGESPKLNIKETKITRREPDVDICGKKE